MAKPPSHSRKELRTSAPYKRSRAAVPDGATPLAKVKLVPAPAVEPAAPPPAPRADAAPAAIVPAAATPPPHAPPPPAPALDDFLGAFQTTLAFADAALAALPHPAEIVDGDPAAPEPPPGPAPAGDARSLRTPAAFALVYRHGAAVISRRGALGQRGTWRVVDYPSAALAAHAYALECSRLVAQGFRDV